MSFSADFNNTNGYRTSKLNDFVLGVSYSQNGATTYYAFDFLARLLTTRTGSSDGGAHVIPFSQLDPDSLATLRERLVELGGKPPKLGDDKKPSLPAPKRPLNL